MDKPIDGSYEFGPFHLHAAGRRLFRAGKIVPLSPKVFDLLLKLVQDAGRALSKDDLARAVWGDSTVTDASLSKNVSQLKRVLMEGQERQQYIERLSSGGYRFVAEVKTIAHMKPVEGTADARCETQQLNGGERLTRYSTKRKPLFEGHADSKEIKLVFQNGVFIPKEPCDLPEGSELELIVESPHVLPPEEKDPEERKRILKAMIERMKQNPIPADAPRFSRDELHERR